MRVFLKDFSHALSLSKSVLLLTIKALHCCTNEINKKFSTFF